MQVHDFTDHPGPSLPFVHVRIWLQSFYLSKHAFALCGEDLYWLHSDLLIVKEFHSEDFKQEAGNLLWELLNHVQLETSTMLEKTPLDDRRYYRDNAWQQILTMLIQDTDASKKSNAYGQLPLHVLLFKGIPCQHILL